MLQYHLILMEVLNAIQLENALEFNFVFFARRGQISMIVKIFKLNPFDIKIEVEHKDSKKNELQIGNCNN